MVLRPLTRGFARLWLAAAALAIAGCATRAPAPPPGSDGPEANPPPAPQLMQQPDAVPQPEPIRSGGPNKPYAVLGEAYAPLPADSPYRELGGASWYGRKFHGRRTASGELYNMYAMSAAHKTLPIPSYARVRNPANGRSVIVRVNDRGPFVKGRIIDLSYTAALKLDLLRGVGAVEVERITPDEIRNGAWRAPAAPAAPVIDGDGGPPEPAVASAPAPLPTPPPTSLPAAVADARDADRAPTVAARGFWVQLGTYRERVNAQQLQQQVVERMDDLALLLAVFSEQALHRVQAGPFATRDEANRVAGRIRERMLLKPLVIERR